MKILNVGDIHGKIDVLNKAFNTFLKGEYDKIIFHGDLADSWDASNSDILRCFNIAIGMKKTFPDKVILLIGNHEEHYLHLNPELYRCAGFRPDLHPSLFPLLNDNRSLFQYAYGIGNYLFTHAGVNKGWFIKNYDIIVKTAEKMGSDICEVQDWWRIIDAISQTSHSPILSEVGPERGGRKSNIGGPIWCDKEEMMNHGPICGFHQVVGHTEQHFIRRVTSFEGKTKAVGKHTSVTFIDVLNYRHQFLTLNI